MITRRQFLKASGLAGAGLLVPWKGRAFAVSIPSLDPHSIPKYEMPLVIPPAMPKTGRRGGADYYEIAVRQFQQQILPPDMPETTVWSYGSVNHPGTFNYPAFTIEANYHNPVRVKWINDLVDANGNFLPHLLPVDPTLHWANPPGGTADRDTRPTFDKTPGPYTGPVPDRDPSARGAQRAGKRRLYRGLVPARGKRHSGRLRHSGYLVRVLQDRIPEKVRRRSGSPARRPSSMRTTSGRAPSGITTTPSA